MKPYTTKQMGDACEMLVAAELTLAGVPALKAPDFWPGYDVIAQPASSAPLRISVKSRTWKAGSAYVRFYPEDMFDWLAIVILFPADRRNIYLVPREVALERFKISNAEGRRDLRVDKVAETFMEFLDNFDLRTCGKDHSAIRVYDTLLDQ